MADPQPLKQGDNTAAVGDLQRALNLCAERVFYPPLVADGTFGPFTLYAFQAIGYALGLTASALARPEVTAVAQKIFADPTKRDAGQIRRAAERAPTLHEHTVAFDGTPTYWGLAKPLLRARKHGWRGTLNSSDRRPGIAEKYGKSSQARLFDCFKRSKALGLCPPDCAGNCNPANPPGASSHEGFSDGSAAFGGRAVGTPLAWWELGVDVEDHDGLLRILASLGYAAKQTYPNSPKEKHHVNFTADPGTVLADTGPAAAHPAVRRLSSVPAPAGARVLTGVDVSNHQPDVDWDQVKAAGHSFAFSKVSEGLGAADRIFGPGRWKAMRDAGLVRGVYHFARPQRGRDPKDEVDEFLGLVERAGGFADGDLVPVLDIEDYGAAGKLNPRQTLEWARGFVEAVHARVGRRPIIYTGVFWREAMGNPPDDLGCPLWLAAYVKDPKPFIPSAWAQESFTIWQHTQSGSTAGIPGNADLNRLPGGEAALNKLRF
jgi:lysozyme